MTRYQTFELSNVRGLKRPIVKRPRYQTSKISNLRVLKRPRSQTSEISNVRDVKPPRSQKSEVSNVRVSNVERPYFGSPLKHALFCNN